MYLPGSVQAGWRAILEHDRWGENWYGLYKSTHGNFFHFRWSYTGTTDFNTVIEPDTWYHIAGTYDGNQAAMYMDGILDGSVTATDAPTASFSGLRIGMNMDDGEAFRGIVDDVKIFNVALTGKEIRDLYTGYLIQDTITRTVSLIHPASSAGFCVFPNPVSHSVLNFLIHGTDPARDVTVTINDCAGKIVMEESFVSCPDTQPVQLNIGHLARGLYMIRISTDKCNHVDRFVKL